MALRPEKGQAMAFSNLPARHDIEPMVVARRQSSGQVWDPAAAPADCGPERRPSREAVI
jgi:hypothetical protein